MEEGTTTTPFDMVVVNNMSRYHLALEAVNRVPRMQLQADVFIAFCEEKLKEHHNYIRENLDDLPEIKNWKWEHCSSI
jgi:xylulose-5-phosphate/fructose-6-phosphate phosphoketolase